jgi:hypothetical protein
MLVANLILPVAIGIFILTLEHFYISKSKDLLFLNNLVAVFLLFLSVLITTRSYQIYVSGKLKYNNLKLWSIIESKFFLLIIGIGLSVGTFIISISSILSLILDFNNNSNKIIYGMLVFAPVAYISTRIILSFIILATSTNDDIKVFDSIKKSWSISNQNTVMIFLLCLIIPLSLSISFGLVGKDILGVFFSKILSMLIIPIETAFISSVYLFLKNKKNQDDVINP